MKNTLVLYKPVGLSPLSCIKAFQAQNPEYEKVKLGYAGRLDPMAEGLLLILVGTENLRRKEYEKLPKRYVFEAIFGIQSDSYDILGIPLLGKVQTNPIELKTSLKALLPDLLGTQIQPYPPYSSPRIGGKPLFWWAREGKLSEISIPRKTIEIYSLTLKKVRIITHAELKTFIFEKIEHVEGDFRQEAIKQAWTKLFLASPTEFVASSFAIDCSSGTYVRSLVHLLEKRLGTCALTLSIKRTRIGNFTEKNVEK